MRPHRSFALLLAAAALTAAAGSRGGAAPVPKHLMTEPVNPEFAALQGKWQVTDVLLGGQSLGTKFATELEMTVEFAGHTQVIVNGRQKLRTTGTLKLDTTASPRRLTLTESKVTDPEGKPVDPPGWRKPSAAIFKFDGDKLVLAYGNGDEKRAPKDFDGKDEQTVTLLLTRVKK